MGANLSYAQQPVLATVPLTKSQVVIPTYFGQVPSNSQVVATLASPEVVVARVLPEYRSQLQAMQNERLTELELQVEALAPKVAVLESGPGRGQTFLNYAWHVGTARSSMHNFRGVLAEKAITGAPLTNKELTPIVDSVYKVLRSEHGATSAHKEAVRQYIASGEADEGTLKLFAAAFERAGVENVFRDFLGYLKLKNELQNAQSEHRSGSQLEELEGAFTAAVAAIKSGGANLPAVEVGGLKVDVYQTLQSMVSAAPEGPFLCDLERLVEAQNNGGLIVPFNFKAAEGANGVPEGIRPNYKPVVWLGRIITVFDSALRDIALVYARQNQEVLELCNAVYSKTRESVGYSPLMRGVLEENPATLALYPDERVLISGAEDLSRRIVAAMRQNLSQIGTAVAEYFGLEKDELKFEDLAKLQSQLMQLLPLQVYTCAAANAKFGMPLQQARKQRAHMAHMHPKWMGLLIKWETSEQRLRRDFNVTLEQILKGAEAIDAIGADAISYFGEQFSFVRHVLASSALEQSEQHEQQPVTL